MAPITPRRPLIVFATLSLAWGVLWTVLPPLVSEATVSSGFLGRIETAVLGVGISIAYAGLATAGALLSLLALSRPLSTVSPTRLQLASCCAAVISALFCFSPAFEEIRNTALWHLRLPDPVVVVFMLVVAGFVASFVMSLVVIGFTGRTQRENA